MTRSPGAAVQSWTVKNDVSLLLTEQKKGQHKAESYILFQGAKGGTHRSFCNKNPGDLNIENDC